MARKRDTDFRDDVLAYGDDRASDDRAVHTEPMQAKLGDKLGSFETLRGQLVDEEIAESAASARERFVRSLGALESTVQRSAKDVSSALRGSALCALAWLRAETRRLAPAAQAKAAPST